MMLCTVHTVCLRLADDTGKAVQYRAGGWIPHSPTFNKKLGRYCDQRMDPHRIV